MTSVLEALERLVELGSRGLLGAPVDLRHQEGLLSIAVSQGLAHALFALAAVVVPTVVHERDARIERAADDADAVVLVGLLADVCSAEADSGHFLAGLAEDGHGHFLP